MIKYQFIKKIQKIQIMYEFNNRTSKYKMQGRKRTNS